MIWRFAECELDEERYELRRRGRAAKLEPRAFDVLLHLLRHRERVVSKAELLEALWPGLAVSDSVLPRCITAARRAVGDDRSRGRVIQTVHGRGYRFVAKAEASEASAGPAPLERASGPVFVGRAEAMRMLLAALEQAAVGRGRVALIVGEPGIGKSRTLEELGAEARRRGVRWLAGQCWEAEGAPAFWPFLQALRSLSPRGAERGASAEGEIFGTLGAAEGEQARFRWFESVARELRRASERAPLLLSIDDLHWADGDALRLFLFLSRELRDAPLLLVGTYRDVEVRRGHALARVLGDLAREPHVARVTLRGLAAGEVAELAASVAGERLEAALTQTLSELTEGNPFFVQEMARWLRESGRLAAGGAHALALPQGVRDAVGRRLDALSEPTNALLRVAAVIGREFSAPLLAEAAGVERPLLALSEAAEAGIVLADAELPGRFRFAHALVRQTLYEELPVAQRVALHRRVAEALERTGAPAAELAHHFFEALPGGTGEEAVRACAAAAANAHERLAYAESARQYERALEALAHAPPDDAKRAELLIALGEERWTDGEREAGRARLGEAAELARRIGRKDLFARAAIGYRGFGELGMPPDAKTLALLEEARDALGDEHPILRSRILARLAGTLPYAASMTEREALAREAWRLAAGSDDRAALVDAIGARYWATLGPDRLEERLAVSSDAQALAERYGDRRLALLGHEIAIGHHLMVGELAAADREIAAYERIADEVRQPVFRFLAGLIRGSRALSTGDFASAEEWIREAHARGRGTIPYADSVFAGQVVLLLFMRGEHERVAEVALSLGDALGRQFAGAGLLNQAMRVNALLWTGRREEARRGYEAFAARDFTDLERDEHWMLALDVIADLAVEFEDRRRADILHAMLLPYRSLLISHDLLRVVTETAEGVLGVLALLAGRVEEALAHYERAVERAGELGLAPALRLAEQGLARARQAAESRGLPRGSPRAPNLKKSSRRPRDPKRAR